MPSFELHMQCGTHKFILAHTHQIRKSFKTISVFHCPSTGIFGNYFRWMYVFYMMLTSVYVISNTTGEGQRNGKAESLISEHKFLDNYLWVCTFSSIKWEPTILFAYSCKRMKTMSTVPLRNIQYGLEGRHRHTYMPSTHTYTQWKFLKEKFPKW